MEPSTLPAARSLRAAGEFVVLLLATLSAWLYAGATPHAEYVLSVGVLILAICWVAHGYVTGRFELRFDFVSIILLGFVVLSLVQLVPIPVALLKVISPLRAHLHETMLPAVAEVLPGETAGEPRSGLATLTVNAHETHGFLAKVLALFIVYVIVRNWLASKDAFKRFLWVTMINGAILALVAVGGFFSTDRKTMLWSIDTGGSVYGTFVCRNHYPDYIAFAMAGAIALFLTPSKQDRLDAEKLKKNPELAGAPEKFFERVVAFVTGPLLVLDRPVPLTGLLAMSLMLLSIPFSLSRGGMASYAVALAAIIVLARSSKTSGTGLSGWGITMVGAALIGAIAYFGTAPIMARFSNFGEAEFDNRTGGWSASVQQVPGVWLAGAGAGTHQWVEPLGRTIDQSQYVYDHAHNEYLEALVEGGLIRLGLTLALAGGVIWQLILGYRRRSDRGVGPALLGVLFGVLVLAIHAISEFSIHLASVALIATIACAYGLSGALDREYAPARKKTKTKSRSKPVVDLNVASEVEIELKETTEPELASRSDESSSGPAWLAWAFAMALVIASLLVVIDFRARYRADRFDATAEAWKLSGLADRSAKRIEYQQLRTLITPGDGDAWYDFAQAHLDAAVQAHPDGGFGPAAISEHIRPALAALRRARSLSPLHADTHVRLGVYASYFANAEPGLAHLQRAIRLVPTDPEVHYAAGSEAKRQNALVEAEEYWKRSLELSPRLLLPILKTSGGLAPSQLVDRILPDDPYVLVKAADELYPLASGSEAERKIFLAKALERIDLPKPTAAQCAAIARAGDEFGRSNEVGEFWKRVLANQVDSSQIRRAAAAWFEKHELYAEAVRELEWLVKYNPSDRYMKERLQAAKHGLELHRQLFDR